MRRHVGSFSCFMLAPMITSRSGRKNGCPEWPACSRYHDGRRKLIQCFSNRVEPSGWLVTWVAVRRAARWRGVLGQVHDGPRSDRGNCPESVDVGQDTRDTQSRDSVSRGAPGQLQIVE